LTRKRKPFPFFLWHRRLGIVSVLLVIILVITGIMLNHTEELGLDKMPVTSDWLLDWYGIHASTPPVSFHVDDHWLVQLDNKVYLDQQHVFNTDEPITGLVQNQQLLVVTSVSQVYLLNNSAELVDQQGLADITGPIQKLGNNAQGVVILNIQGDMFAADKDIIDWHRLTKTIAHWSRTAVAPTQVLNVVNRLYRQQALNMERVVLDLHSGRLLHPRYGVWLMDAAAVVLLLLSFSGLWVWWSRKRKMRHKKHYRKHHRL